MIIWGGLSRTIDFNNGGRYSPATDTWTPMTTANAPFARANHTAVWTGSEMIVWGGIDYVGIFLNSGGIYCAQPSTPIVQSVVSQRGTPSSIMALQITRVFPIATSTEPLACGAIPSSNLIGRN